MATAAYSFHKKHTSMISSAKSHCKDNYQDESISLVILAHFSVKKVFFSFFRPNPTGNPTGNRIVEYHCMKNVLMSLMRKGKDANWELGPFHHFDGCRKDIFMQIY